MFAHQHIKQHLLSNECAARTASLRQTQNGPSNVLDQGGTKWMDPQAAALLFNATDPYGQERQSRACIGALS